MATAEEKLREAKLKQAKLKQQLLTAKSQAVDPMLPSADDTPLPEKEEKPTDFRTEYAQPGLELAKQASGGLNPYTGEGVTDLPEEMPLGYGDIQVKFPKAFRDAVEFIGDGMATAAGYGMAGYGYLVGGAADILTRAGVDENTADRFARDMMAMPDAFAGSPTSVMRPRNVRNPSVGGVQEAEVARRFTPDELAALRETELQIDATPTPPPAPSMTPERLGELIRVASSGGRGSQAAAEAIAQAARINPQAAAAARRLGIDVPADVLSDDTQLKGAAGLSRSLAGSEAEATFRDTVVLASQRADEIMRELDANPDISSIADRVKTDVLNTRGELERSASEMYKQVDQLVPASSVVEPRNSVMLINQILEEVGGVGALTGKEKALFNKLTDANTPLTFAALKKFRNSIGRAINKGEGEYADMDTGTAKRIYAALTDDYLDTAQSVGGDQARSTLRLANQTTAKQKALEKRLVSFFGKDGEGSIAPKLLTAINSGKKGDIANLNRTLKIIPQELQREAVATAIGSLTSSTAVGFDGPFDFAKFAQFYDGLKKNGAVYSRVMKILGPETAQTFADLNEMSKRITQARGAVLSTGKSNQALVQAMTADGLIKSVLNTTMGNRIVRGVAGQAAGGPAGGAAADAVGEILLRKTDKQKIQAAGDFLNSPAFKSLAMDASQPNMDKVMKSPAYKRFANAVGITDPRNWLQTALLVSADEGVIQPPVEAPVEAPAQEEASSASLQSILGSLNPDAAQKVLDATR
jgi:hypothetical protein